MAEAKRIASQIATHCLYSALLTMGGSDLKTSDAESDAGTAVGQADVKVLCADGEVKVRLHVSC
jgi:hypothetical protein